MHSWAFLFAWVLLGEDVLSQHAKWEALGDCITFWEGDSQLALMLRFSEDNLIE